MRVAMLTGGGDCPGLNAVMRAVVLCGEAEHGDVMVGFRDGWRGVIERCTVPLTSDTFVGFLDRGGTLLGSSRTNPFKDDADVQRVRSAISSLDLDALVVIGGEDTLGVAARLHELDVRVVGVPKTIDNDLSATESTVGFDTAVAIATEAIDRLRTTAESHDRAMVVEVMGRHAGHIAAWAGLAGGATLTLIPEEPFDIDEVCEVVRRNRDKGRRGAVVVVAEGAVPESGTLEVSSGEVDQFGHARLGGIGSTLANLIEERTGIETRATALGHLQRGGTPTAFDRVLATRLGVAAIDAVHDGAWGQMVALRCGQIVRVPLAEAVDRPKLVDPALYHGVVRRLSAP